MPGKWCHHIHTMFSFLLWLLHRKCKPLQCGKTITASNKLCLPFCKSPIIWSPFSLSLSLSLSVCLSVCLSLSLQIPLLQTICLPLQNSKLSKNEDHSSKCHLFSNFSGLKNRYLNFSKLSKVYNYLSSNKNSLWAGTPPPPPPPSQSRQTMAQREKEHHSVAKTMVDKLNLKWQCQCTGVCGGGGGGGVAWEWETGWQNWKNLGEGKGSSKRVKVSKCA